jgi:hypothetical protein
MIVNVYVDESGTHGPSSLMTLSGYIATVGQWHKFDSKWARMLRRHGLTYVHAVEIWHGQGEWKGWDIQRKIKLAKEAEKLCQQHTLCGFTVVLAEADYRNRYVADNRSKKIHLDTQYGLCFRSCLSLLPSIIAKSLSRDDVAVNFILESGHRHVLDAQDIFSKVRKAGFPDISPFLGTFSVGDKKRFAGLQAADMLAYSSYRLEQENPDFVEYPADATTQQAGKLVGQRSPAFRLIVDRRVLEELTEGLLALKEAKRQFGERRHVAREVAANG